MLKSFFETATNRSNGDRVNYHHYQGKIKVQTYTEKGVEWVTIEHNDFDNNYLL